MTANNFIHARNICTNFYYGNQWIAATENTKLIPRPVFNMCALIVDSKASNITNVPSKIVYKTNQKDRQDPLYLTEFSSYLLKEMGYEETKDRLVTQSLIKGTAFIHFFWDETAIGTYGDYVGGTRCEYIDMKDVVVANPKKKDLQSQEYVIIRSRASVKSLRKKLKNKELANKIKPDSDELNETGTQEQNDEKLCTTYLMYYRKGGEVCYSLSTKEVVIFEDKALNPNIYKINEKEMDTEYLDIPDLDLEKNNASDYQEVKFNRYPIAVLTLRESDDSLYGISAIYDIINSQKYINHLYAMQLLNIQNTAWDKYVVKKDALRNQVINDQPGQVLTDFSATGDGIRRLGSQSPMANGSVDLALSVYNMIKTTSQTNDAFLGQSEKQLSGVANSLLQAQNDQPIERMRKKLYSFEEEIGNILVLFIKLYYTYQEFYYELDDATVIRNKTINSISGNGNNQLPTEKFQVGTFNSSSIENLKFHVMVEAMEGSRDSTNKLNNIIQALFINGAWNNMDVHAKKLFIEMYDMPEKDKFRAMVEQEENDYTSQLEQQIAQLQQVIQQQTVTLQRSKNAIEYIGRMNQSLQNSYKTEFDSHQKDIKSLSKKLSLNENDTNNESEYQSKDRQDVKVQKPRSIKKEQ